MAKTILLIDNDVSHADALKFYLARKHVEVLAGSTTEQVHRFLADFHIDIILGNPYGLGERFPADLKKIKQSDPLPPLIVFAPKKILDQAMDDFGSVAINYLETPLNSKALALALQHAEQHIATEKKLANYSQRLSDLHNAQILYYQLFHEVPCYITVQNKDLRLTDTNLKFKKDFGNAVGGYCYETYKHRSSPCPECPVAKTFSDGESHGTEEVVTSKSGRQYNVITQTAPIKDENGKITQVMEISTNITKIRQLQDHLASLGLMLGTISHGIKGMLTVLDGSVYQLETGLQKDDQQRVLKGFGQIKKISEGIKKLVLDILNYAKSRELQYELVDVNDLANKVVSTIRKQANDNGVKLKTDIAKSLGTVEMDLNWISTALINLMENAVDACAFDAVGKDHYVKLKAWAKGEDKICILVEDNGIGMDKKTQEELFTLFFSSKGSQGTGLGLFITNHVVEQHGGAIKVRSQLNEGTSFEVSLPRQRTERPTVSFFPKTYKSITF